MSTKTTDINVNILNVEIARLTLERDALARSRDEAIDCICQQSAALASNEFALEHDLKIISQLTYERDTADDAVNLAREQADRDNLRAAAAIARLTHERDDARHERDDARRERDDARRERNDAIGRLLAVRLYTMALYI